MEIFIAVCLALIVVELGVLAAFAAAALLKVRQASQAVEVAAYRVDAEVHSVGESLRSGWGRAAGTLLSAAVQLFR
ncbi:MAG: hypothetical protein KGM24_08210 [Elusimicrobia bacterium]|nr:hypothetical protein [Elusimicrobiota bacterium]